MNKSLFRKKTLAAVIAATVPFIAAKSDAVTLVTDNGDTYAASGFFGAITFNVYAEEGEDYTFILDADNGSFQVQNSAFLPVNIYNNNEDGIAVIWYRKANSGYSINLPFRGVSAGIYGKGTTHGILLKDGTASVVQINIGESYLGAEVKVEQGDAFRIEEEMLGTLTVSGILQGKTAIRAVDGGRLGSGASIVVKSGQLLTNGDTSVDFSGSSGALVLSVDSGTLSGKLLGYTGAGDTLTTDGSSTFGGDIENVETINVRSSGSSATSFRGDINKVSGGAHVYVYGTASFDKALVDTEKVLPPQEINGDLTVKPTGLIKTIMESDSATNAAIVVTGTATIGTGSKLRIIPSEEVLRSGTTVEDAKIIKATNLNVSGGLSGVTVEHSVLINAPSLSLLQSGTVLGADVTPRSTELLQALAAEVGAGATTEEALAGLLAAITQDPNNPTSFNNFYRTVSSITDVKKLAEVARESKFNNSDAIQIANVTAEAKVKSHVLSHVRDVQEDGDQNNGLNYGGSYSNEGFWIQFLGSDVSQDDRKNDGGDKIFGFDADLSGLTLGTETTINEEYLVGAAFTIANVDIKKHGSNDNSTIKNYQFSLYGSWELDDWFVDGVANFGQSDNKRNRYIDGFVDTPISSDFKSKQFGLTAMAGWNQSYDKMKIVPMVGFNYAMVRSEAFEEEDKYATGFALDVDSQKYQKVELGAGVELSQTFRVSKGEIEPSLRMMAWHDFKGDEVETTTRYVLGGTEFTSKGADAVKNSYQVSANVTYRRNDNMSFVVGYELNQKSDYKAQNYYLRMKYDF
ncbi:autotransporter outer membrane beta-barrel domain-containing protein [Endozoicomonas arenosclerae]|uniref:autotransporter family protein n=1 Tax=Endozoicomonas arenosclerae TaxID=1633495 RepID=UPI00078304FF|nr:autotransporter outer membrane beta-barrel domain-containing protein [Endozoicomonas arenosclerae]